MEKWNTNDHRNFAATFNLIKSPGIEEMTFYSPVTKRTTPDKKTLKKAFEILLDRRYQTRQRKTTLTVTFCDKEKYYDNY